MSDLIKRDDALRSLEEWYARTCKPETLQGLADILAGYSAYKDIAEIPAVDAVSVVRCKDCIHFFSIIFGSHCQLLGTQMDKDGYCSCGERREGNAVD